MTGESFPLDIMEETADKALVVHFMTLSMYGHTKENFENCQSFKVMKVFQFLQAFQIHQEKYGYKHSKGLHEVKVMESLACLNMRCSDLFNVLLLMPSFVSTFLSIIFII